MKKQTLNKTQNLRTAESFIGESLEDKIRRIQETKEPIEAISPMIYTERKDGVKAEHNIRTDKWEVAQQAMTTVSQKVRERRTEKIKKAEKTTEETK